MDNVCEATYGDPACTGIDLYSTFVTGITCDMISTVGGKSCADYYNYDPSTTPASSFQCVKGASANSCVAGPPCKAPPTPPTPAPATSTPTTSPTITPVKICQGTETSEQCDWITAVHCSSTPRYSVKTTDGVDQAYQCVVTDRKCGNEAEACLNPNAPTACGTEEVTNCSNLTTETSCSNSYVTTTDGTTQYCEFAFGSFCDNSEKSCSK